jgi:4-hydroxyphenylacetate 3-monooxygenase
MFYAGAPFLVRSRMAQVYDFGRARRLVDALLESYGPQGRIEPDATS